MRIASVLPSATETVAALGAAGELVARSAECDYPASVRSLPVLMRPTTLDADRPSGEIDRRVREARERSASLYTIDTEVLARARPDVLFTQDLCGVCSVTGDEVRAACRAADVAPEVISLSPRNLAEVAESIRTVGRAIGRPEAGGRIAAGLDRHADTDVRPTSASVAVVEWLDPPILAGLWTPDIVAGAGARYIGPDPGSPGEPTSWESVGRAAPEVVVLAPCSFSVSRSLSELSSAGLGGEVERALRGARVVVADEAYFSRPGPRLAWGIDLIAGLTGRAAADTAWPMPVVRWDSARTGVTA